MLAIPEVDDGIPRTDRDSFPERPWHIGNRFSNVVALDWLQLNCGFNQWVKSRGAGSPVFHEEEEIVGDQVVKVGLDND